MEPLRELAFIVNKNKLKAIDILDPSQNTLVANLYHQVLSKKFNSEKELAKNALPNRSRAIYRQVKASLKNKLINSLFLMDNKQPNFTDRQKAYYECHKQWAAAKMLLGKNAWDACIEICERILKHTLQYELTELTVDLLRVLRLNYSTRTVNKRLYNKYNAMLQEYEHILLAENEVERHYCELIIHYINSRSRKENLIEQAQKSSNSIDCLMKQYDTYRLHLYGSMIKLMVHTTKNEYERTLDVCDEIIHFFKAKPYQATNPLQAAYYQKLICYSQLCQFEEGKKVAKQCLAITEEGVVNWFKYYELYIIFLMHTDNYTEAFQVYQKVTSHRRFVFQSSDSKEIWSIYEAYLHYLIALGLVELNENQDKFPRFRIGRFLNNTPIFSKDKRGLNVAILTVQFLFLLQQKKYNKAIDRLEAIEKYCTRYLNKDDTIRSYYFIKMLLTIPTASFNNKRVIRHAERYHRKLEGVPLETAHQVHKIEIIPYEKLWSFVLASLS